MTIEFKADEIRAFIKDRLSLEGFETIVIQELDRIVNRHRQAAIDEIQKFAFKLATTRHVEGFGLTMIIKTNEEQA